MLEKNNNNKKMIDANIKIMSIITLVISHKDYIVEHIVYNFLKRRPKEMYAEIIKVQYCLGEEH